MRGNRTEHDAKKSLGNPILRGLRNAGIPLGFAGPKSRWEGKGHWTLSEARNNIDRPSTIIRDVLPASGVTFLLSPFSVGKTQLLLDLALHIATNQDWQGIPTLKGRQVIFLAGEDEANTMMNWAAWMKHHDYKEDDPNVRFAFYDQVVDLLSDNDCKAFVADLKIKLPLDGPGPIIFIDTWQRATSGASQNDDEKMQIAIRNAEMIGRALRAPIVIAAHPPKGNDKTISGSAIMQNTSAAIWMLEIPKGAGKGHENPKHSSERVFFVDRIKGARHERRELLRRAEIELSEFDEWGRPIRGAILVNDKASAMEMTHSADVGLDGVDEAIVASVRGDPTLSYAKRSAALGLKLTTLKNRAAKLINEGRLLKIDGGLLRVPEAIEDVLLSQVASTEITSTAPRLS